MSTDRAPHVARYRLAERLGAGGLGVVMAAEDPELGRRVAIKLIRTGSTDRRAIDRLEREAAALARVSHPHVVGVFDVGRYDVHEGSAAFDRWPPDVPLAGVYIVMELCEGIDLATWLRTQRAPQEVLRVFRAAGGGLAAAHAAGVVHRDFKPANVMVDRHGGVKVLDFGLAQWLHGAEPSTLQEGVDDGGPVEPSSSMTMTGTVMGTPAYMAPEQHKGGKVDERSDQYAYCVALAEALSGARPFTGETVAELHMAKHDLRFDPRMREIPPRLRAVLERGLAREPDARWASMVELLRALEEPRSYAGWWGAGLLTGALGLGSWVVVGSTDGSEPVAPGPEAAAVVVPDGNPPSEPAKALREAAEIAAVGRGARASLTALLERVAPGSTVPGDPALAAEVLLWRGRLAEDAVASEIYRRAYFVAREADVPSIAARAAIAMTTTAGDDHGLLLDEWIRHAWIEVERAPEDREATVEVAIRGAHGRAVGMSDEIAVDSLSFAAAVVGDVEPTDGIYVAHLLLELSAGWRAVEELDLALHWARRAEALLDAVAEPDHPLHAHAAAEIARTLYWQDFCQEALPSFDVALAGFAAMGPEGDEEAALARGLMAECLHDLGLLDTAMAEYRRALEFWETEMPELAVPQQRVHFQLGLILRELGRTAEAEQEYERVLALVDPNAPDHPTRRRARKELAELRGEVGE